jgi:hypothetical protein
MVRVRLHEDGTLSREEVAEHPERRVIRERLVVALSTGEVLP